MNWVLFGFHKHCSGGCDITETDLISMRLGWKLKSLTTIYMYEKKESSLPVNRLHTDSRYDGDGVDISHYVYT